MRNVRCASQRSARENGQPFGKRRRDAPGCRGWSRLGSTCSALRHPTSGAGSPGTPLAVATGPGREDVTPSRGLHQRDSRETQQCRTQKPQTGLSPPFTCWSATATCRPSPASSTRIARSATSARHGTFAAPKAREFWEAYRHWFGGIESTLRNVIVSDCRAALECTTTGSSASGDPIAYDGVSILEMTNGRITRCRAYFDPGGLGEQMHLANAGAAELGAE